MLEKFFKLNILQNLVLSSYWICLIGGVIGLILFVFGCQKGKKMAMVSPAIYIIIRILGSVILGV